MPAWLDETLAQLSHINLDHRDGRARFAEAILGALPRRAMEIAVLVALVRLAREDTIDPLGAAHSIVAAIEELLAR